MHEVKGGDWSSLVDEGDVGGNKISGADVINKDGVMKVVLLCEEMIKRVGELRRKDDCLPLGMVSGGVEMGHRVVEAFMEVQVRGGSPRGLGAFG